MTTEVTVDPIDLVLTDTERLVRYWQLRNQQIISDLEIINLVRPIQTTDKQRWLTNEPKVFFDTARSLISINQPQFRLPMSINYKEEDKQKMNKAERLLIGVYRTLDNRLASVGETMWLWQLAYWMLLGWYSVFTIVQKTDEGVEFIADIWNPMDIYPQWDNTRMIKCVRTYQVDSITAIAMAQDFEKKGLKFEFKQPSLDTSTVDIVNYWMDDGKKVWNSVLIDKQLIKPLTHQKKLKRIPVHVGAIGSPDKSRPNWESRRGESIIASNREIYEHQNTILTLMATILAETAYPNIATKTRSGAPAIKTEQMQGYGEVIPLRLEDSIELLKHAATPEEANYLLNYLGSQMQKGSIPNSAYGFAPFEVSGFALSQFLAAIKYKLEPYVNAMQLAISRIMTDFLYQYRVGNFGKMTLHTANPYDVQRGKTYIEEFSKEDVPDNIYVEVKLPITSKFDKTQAILNARQAIAPPQLFSRETLWETELDVQDTEQEYERIRQDQVMDDPFIKQIEIIERMWQRVEAYELKGNKSMAAALRRYIQGLEAQIGITPQKKQTKELGVPPNQMPPEAMESPDMMRQITGTPPPGLNRLPETPEVRDAKQEGLPMGVPQMGG